MSFKNRTKGSKRKSQSQRQRMQEGQLLEQGMDWYFLIPLAMVGAFVPTVVYLQIIDLPEHIARFWTSAQVWDFFSYHKARWLFIFTGLSALALVLGLLQQTVKLFWDKIYIPMGLFTLFTILSAIFADPLYREIALRGFPDRMEGTYVWISYLLVMFMAIVMVRREQHIKLLTTSLLISGSLLSIIGIFQYFGMDIFRSEFGRNFIVPSFYEGIADELNFTFGAKTIYSTLYNTNYVGSYMAMLLLLSLGLYLYSNKKNATIMYAVTSVLLFSNLIGSNSRAGLVGFLVGLTILCVSSYKDIIKSWKKTTTITTIMLILVFAMNLSSDGRIYTSFKSLYNFKGEITKDYEEIGVGNSQRPMVLENLTIIDNKIILDMTRDKLIIELDRPDASMNYTIDDYSFYNDLGDKLRVEYNNENKLATLYRENDKTGFAVLIVDNLIEIRTDSYSVALAADEKGKIWFINNYYELVELTPAVSFGFEGREKIGSSRGYIWSRTIPLLKDTILIGHGADTYPMYFPQSDYIAKTKYVGNAFALVDKPHNMYLQIAVNLGVVSLFMFLVILIIYFTSAINAQRTVYSSLKHGDGAGNDENKPQLNRGSSVGILGAIIAYLVSAIFNDSLISVAPVFFLILGLGYKINNITIGLHEEI